MLHKNNTTDYHPLLILPTDPYTSTAAEVSKTLSKSKSINNHSFTHMPYMIGHN